MSVTISGHGKGSGLKRVLQCPRHCCMVQVQFLDKTIWWGPDLFGCFDAVSNGNLRRSF
jgi:hypothetical protein